MIYLFSQIAVSLALAAIVGGAAGWLAHRARAGKQIRNLQQVVGRQQQHVNEAQTEVSLISGDYDDLKQRSEAEIDALEQDNQKIPALHQNLEKSQLLVRQLMQQHKAELDELTIENEKLAAKAKLVDEREKAVTKLQADLDIERRKNTQSAQAETGKATQAELSLAETDEDAPANSATNKEQTAANSKTIKANASDHASASKGPDGSNVGSANEPKANAAADTAHHKNADSAAKTNSPARRPLSANSIDASASNELTPANNPDAATAAKLKSKAASAAETEVELKALRDQLAADAPKPLDTSALRVDANGSDSTSVKPQSSKTKTLKSNSTNSRTIVSATAGGAVVGKINPEPNELKQNESAKTEATQTSKDKNGANGQPHKLSETQVNNNDLEPLFEPVDQHDDLKQIFGIGPVTEKTLNKLGITAYSQLAELKQHDIEKIAGALQIFPGRIERDNWVGSARTQLEEVLEEL